MNDNKNESALKKFIKKAFTSEAKVSRIPYYFFAICILLTGIFVELCFNNMYLNRLVKGKEAYVYNSAGNYDIVSKTTLSTTLFYSPETSAEPVTDTTVNSPDDTGTTKAQANSVAYVINKSSKKIHYSDCSYAASIKDENKIVVNLTYDELQSQYLSNGYSFCSKCAER